MDSIIVIEIFDDNTSQVWSEASKQDLVETTKQLFDDCDQLPYYKCGVNLDILEFAECRSLLKPENGRVFILSVDQAIEAYKTVGKSLDICLSESAHNQLGEEFNNLKEKNILDLTFLNHKTKRNRRKP